jgi:hypothetical protein
LEGAGVGSGDSVQGRVEAIHGTSAAGKGRRPWGRRWSRPCLAPPTVRHGIRQGRGKGEGKGELTGGPHMAVKQGEVKGRRAGWLCWAEMHRRAGGLCRAAGQDGGGLADFY